jgi:hypothetical protein
MSTIVTRAGKGTPLTNAEVDANFLNLNTDKLELSGGTLTGFLTLHAAPTASLHAASKGYVDGVVPTQTGNSGKFLTTNGTALSWGTVDLTPYLAKSGGTMTGAITFAAGQTWPTFNQNTTGTAAGLSATLAIASGGTGATSAATALTNLGAQATLVSATNIKTVNGNSLLGAGNIAVSASPGGANTQVQYNSGGAFAGSANMTFDGASLTVAGNVTANSDETLKINWRDLPTDFIDHLANVKHGTYDRTDMPLTQDGVSAQSLRKLLENSVLEDEDGKLSVAYGNAALVSAIQLAKRLVALEAIVAKLVD